MIEKHNNIQYCRGSILKYSNKLFPRFIGKHWVVWINETEGKTFRRFEEAVLFEKLLQIEKLIKEKCVGQLENGKDKTQ